MSQPAVVTRVFHFTAVVADCDATVVALSRLFGAAVLHTASGEMFGVTMRRAMLWIGDSLLEVIQPIGESAFQGFLDRFGGGLNSLGLEVADAAAAEAHLAAHGIDVAVRYGPAMFATRTSGTAGLALQFTSEGVADDPRRAPVARPRPVGAVVMAERLAFVAALVTDPPVAADGLARAFGTDATRIAPGPLAGPEASVGIGDCSLALYRLSEAAAPGIWGDRHQRPRLLAFGLQVADLAQALTDLDAAGIGVAAEHAVGILLDLSATPIPILLCDRLLPGDARRRGADRGR